jgi:hypothetical protein
MEPGSNVLCPLYIIDQAPIIIDGSVLLGVWPLSGSRSKPIVVGRADARRSFRQATWHVLPRNFYSNHTSGFQERMCGWYEVDNLPALKGKTCVGIGILSTLSLVLV